MFHYVDLMTFNDLRLISFETYFEKSQYLNKFLLALIRINFKNIYFKLLSVNLISLEFKQ